MKIFFLLFGILSLISCSNSNNEADSEIVVAVEVAEHNHEHDHVHTHEEISSLENKVRSLEEAKETILELEGRISLLEQEISVPQINYTGEEAEAIKELLKKSPYIYPYLK